MLLMTNPTPPLVSRRLVGNTLRQLRQARGLSLEQASAAIGMSFTAMLRYESAKNAPKPPTLRALLELYDAPAGTVDDLLKVLSAASTTGWWSKFSGGLSVPGSFIDYSQMEQSAERIRIYSPFVPGLLQTAAYAEAILSHMPDAAKLIDLRRRRQELFDRGVPVHVVLDESAISRRVGGTDAWLDQLEFLISLAKRDHVTVQLLAYDDGQHGAAVGGPFTLLDLGEDDTVVYVENLSFGTFFEGAPVTEYRGAWDRLTEYAGTHEETLLFLRTLFHEERAAA